VTFRPPTVTLGSVTFRPPTVTLRRRPCDHPPGSSPTMTLHTMAVLNG
jgi:hypothetical protein